MATKKTKEDISRKAIDLFKEKGLENVSVSEICSEARITRNTFYYYFNSKEDLFIEYFKRSIRSQTEIFATIISTGSDWERYLKIYEMHLLFLVEEGVQFSKQLLKIALLDNSELIREYYYTNEWCIPILARCVEEGIVRDELTPKKLDYYAERLSIGILATWCSMNGDFDLVSVVKEGLETLLLKA